MNQGSGQWERLCELVSGLGDKDGVPGASLGVLHGNETYTAGFGVTNVDHPLGVTNETYFQTGSISKTFVATAMMRLMEAGKLDLDATVRTYLPEFRVADEEVSARVTVLNLLTHMGNWEGDFFRHTGQGDDALIRYMTIMKEIAQLAPLGTVWSYNNAGFAVCGRIIEVLTQKNYDVALADLVLDPLGLTHCFLDHADVMIHRFATGHDMKDEEPCVASPWPLPRYAWPAGGVMCHIKDLLRYARFHLGDGRIEGKERLLKTETMDFMRSPRAPMWGAKEAMGISWFLKDTGAFRQIWHGGGTTGQVCMLMLVPERSFAAAILTNGSHGRRLIRESMKWAQKEFLGFETPHPSPLGAPEKDLLPFSGRYWRPYAEMEIGMLGGKLLCQHIPKAGFPTEKTPAPPAEPPWTLDLCDTDRLLVLDGELKDALVDVIRRPDGSIGWLRLGGRIYVRKIDGP